MGDNYSSRNWYEGGFMEIHKIVLPTPYPIGDVNAFLVKGDTLTLFDVGPKTQEAYEALKWGINEVGYDMKEIEQVVLTHHHPDHAGWVDAFPDADILGHRYIDHWLRRTEEFISYRNDFYREQLHLQAVPERYIEKMVQSRGEMELLGSIPLTKFIKNGDEIPGHVGLKAYYTPGHSQSHFIFVDEKLNEVIGGDLLLEKVAANPLVEPPVDLSKIRPNSLIQQQESLKLLRDLHVAKVYPGHGDVIENVNELIDNRLERDTIRMAQLMELINAPKTVMELTMESYPVIYKKELGLTLSKTIGYLDCLVRDGLVKVDLINGVNIYSR